MVSSDDFARVAFPLAAFFDRAPDVVVRDDVALVASMTNAAVDPKSAPRGVS
jgi:hypothetical protein